MRIKNRISVWKSTTFWGWWKVGVITFAVIGFYDLLQGQISTVSLPSLENIISWWDWKVWFILALILGLAGIMEGTYRHITKLKEEKDKLKDVLDSKNKRKSVAENLTDFHNSGDELLMLVTSGKEKNSLNSYKEWGEKVKDYFYANPDELGKSKMLGLIPSNAELTVPLPSVFGEEDGYVYIMLTIQLDKLKKLVEDFLK